MTKLVAGSVASYSAGTGPCMSTENVIIFVTSWEVLWSQVIFTLAQQMRRYKGSFPVNGIHLSLYAQDGDKITAFDFSVWNREQVPVELPSPWLSPVDVLLPHLTIEMD